MRAWGGHGSSSCPWQAGGGQVRAVRVTLPCLGWCVALNLLPAAAGAGADPRPSLPSAGSVCVFPVVLCSSLGQNVLGIDFSDCFSSHPRLILKASSLGLFCCGNGLAVEQFSLAVMPTWYLLHYLWHNSNTVIKNPLNHAR